MQMTSPRAEKGARSDLITLALVMPFTAASWAARLLGMLQMQLYVPIEHRLERRLCHAFFRVGAVVNDDEDHAFSRVIRLVEAGYKLNFERKIGYDAMWLKHILFPDLCIKENGLVYSLESSWPLKIEFDDKQGFDERVRGLRTPTVWELFKKIWILRISVACIVVVFAIFVLDASTVIDRIF